MVSAAVLEGAAFQAIPEPGEIDAAWLASVLATAGQPADIASVAMEPVGTGQLGDTVRFTIRYGSNNAPGPRTIIGKFAAADPTSREVAAAWKLYEREVNFYRELAPRAGIATPACYAAFMGAEGKFVLLLEDLTPARPGDQIAGIALDDAAKTMREAARLHAAFWDRGADEALGWLETGPLAQPFYAPDVYRRVWPIFAERYADQLTADQRRVCQAFAEHYESYSRPLDRPRCVTHNDYRPDNMLFSPDGRLTVVDWQSAALGYNAVDVAYLIGGAFTREARREVERGLLDIYHAELVGSGVSGYGRDALDADYRHFSFAGVNVAVGAAIMVKRTERGDRMFLTMLDRHVSHVLDLGALSILQERRCE